MEKFRVLLHAWQFVDLVLSRTWREVRGAPLDEVRILLGVS